MLNNLLKASEFLNGDPPCSSDDTMFSALNPGAYLFSYPGTNLLCCVYLIPAHPAQLSSSNLSLHESSLTFL